MNDPAIDPESIPLPDISPLWYKTLSTSRPGATMSLPEIEQHRVKKLLCAFIKRRVPPHARVYSGNNNIN